MSSLRFQLEFWKTNATETVECPPIALLRTCEQTHDELSNRQPTLLAYWGNSYYCYNNIHPWNYHINKREDYKAAGSQSPQQYRHCSRNRCHELLQSKSRSASPQESSLQPHPIGTLYQRQIRKQNNGMIKIRQKPLKLVCSKTLLFFTRDTKHKIFHKTRCAEAGSCTQNRCNTLKPHENVEELQVANKYPGYSACEHTCGGLLCGCFLPVQACSFIRVAQIPISKSVYEVVSCKDWTPLIEFEVEFKVHNMEQHREFTLMPYVTQSHEEIALTVISIQRPSASLFDQRFAISQEEALVITAATRWCVTAIATKRHNLRSLHEERGNLAIKSSLLINSAEFVIEQQCSVELSLSEGLLQLPRCLPIEHHKSRYDLINLSSRKNAL
ncbi:hypothetical protein COOONC_02070 [Cooperia oncophora]